MLLSSNFELQDYEKIGNIGQGAFGKVYKIKHKTDSIIYAAKETDQINLREFQILYQISHPLIVKFIGLSKTNFQNCPNPVIITEYIPNKSLENYIDLAIHGYAPQEFETQKIIIIYGIALAMAFLHENKILHRDLKPANILLDNSFHPIICDFGLSKKANTSDTLEYLGTPLYSSPEIISDNKYTEAGDVYAFGMIVYELILNKRPFNDIHNLFNLATKIENGERPPIEGPIPTSFQNLIESCWAQDPNKRPSFANIVDQMKNDDGFITELVDEGQYYDFIDQMNEIKTEFTPMPELLPEDYEKLSPKEMFEYAKNKEDMHEYKEARRCFQIAATTREKISCRYYELKECRDSMLSYALMCKKGNGGPVDIPSYIEYLKKAANFALPQASYLYGLELEKGELFTKNLDLAALYFRSSADYSNHSAIRKYIEYLSKGIGVRKNVFKALKYCKKLINSCIKNEGLKKYQNILDHINDIDETNDVNEIFEKDNINMRSGIIYFNNKKYKNDVNTICSGSQSLDEQLIELERRRLNVYPQGFEYCKNLLIQQKNINGTVIICNTKTKPHWTTFYFELPFDDGRLLIKKVDIDIELDIIKYRDRNGIYPQGYNYVQRLLHEKMANKDDCIRVLSRKISPSSYVSYYFKTKYIMKHPSAFKGKQYFEGVFYKMSSSIEKEIEDLIKRKDNNFEKYKDCDFPDGYENCMRFLEQKREKNEDYIVIRNTIEKLGKEAIRFFDTKFLFENMCDEEYILKNEDELRKEIDKIKHITELRDKFSNTNWRLRQYIDYKLDLVGLIEEQIKNNGKVHVLIRLNQSYHLSMYYFKA